MSEEVPAGAMHVPLSISAAFEDLETRFLLNLPDHEFDDVPRLFFHIEQAYWFYEDFLADKYDHLPNFKKFESFAETMFEYCEVLKPMQGNYQKMLKQFKKYKNEIPVYGAILLNKNLTKMLLVEGFYSKRWGFPKGKVNENEEEVDCAIREVYEETNYHIINEGGTYSKENFVESKQGGGKYIKLFIVQDVDEKFEFTPRVRKEISGIQWFPVDIKMDGNDSFVWLVGSVLPPLRDWIRNYKRSQSSSNKKVRKKKKDNKHRQTGGIVIEIDTQMVLNSMMPILRATAT
mmetsp:Transcript_14732/g.16681  ORF Transcript_14732/g.16681 Transcript_14732/m.16681 type:complete len:290 (-) Transcript_14732:1215-2084(-)